MVRKEGSTIDSGDGTEIAAAMTLVTTSRIKRGGTSRPAAA
jgi:hypothetical protein